MNTRLLTVSLLAFVLAAGGVACSGKEESSKAPKPAAVSVPDSLFAATAPADAKDVKVAKPTLKKGDKVTVVGRIGGSVKPFVAERAVFTLADKSLKACGEDNPDDKCKTPWDFCCDPRDVITANTLTVQVVDAEGKPLKTGLDGVKGLKPLATVTVTGTVATAEGGTVVINASGLHVKN
jgi:hypothetical protein